MVGKSTETTPKKRILIVGQGLAGTLVADALIQRGQEITVVSAGHKESASWAAAGLINPVTGKRFVIQKDFEARFEQLQAFYHDLEERLRTRFFYPVKIRRYLPDSSAKAAFAKRVRQGLPSFIHYTPDKDSFLITTAGYCQTALLVEHYQDHLKQQSRLIEAHLSPDDVTLTSAGIQWKGKAYDSIIFTRGHKDEGNPWFPGLPFESAWGSVLTLKQPENLPDSEVSHAGKWILPLKDGTARAGATFSWDLTQSPEPESETSAILAPLAPIAPLLGTEPEVLEIRQAIRPILKDREAVLGRSPHSPHVLIFNGLGPHGVMKGPTLAQELADHITTGSPITPGVSTERFLT